MARLATYLCGLLQSATIGLATAADTHAISPPPVDGRQGGRAPPGQTADGQEVLREGARVPTVGETLAGTSPAEGALQECRPAGRGAQRARVVQVQQRDASPPLTSFFVFLSYWADPAPTRPSAGRSVLFFFATLTLQPWRLGAVFEKRCAAPTRGADQNAAAPLSALGPRAATTLWGGGWWRGTRV